MWLRFEPGLEEWIEKLELSPFYIGIYVLIIAAAVMMLISFIGCVAALQENTVTILIVSKQKHLSRINEWINIDFNFPLHWSSSRFLFFNVVTESYRGICAERSCSCYSFQEENHLVKSERELVAHKERSRLTPAKIVVLFVPSTECGTGVCCFVLVPLCQDKCPRQFTIFLRLEWHKFRNCYYCRRGRRDAL